MAWKVVWAESALHDLECVFNFIADDSPYYAASFVREVRGAARSLSAFAERGRVVPEYGKTEVRELFVRHYRLIYKLTEKTVFILAFLHGARQLKNK